MKRKTHRRMTRILFPKFDLQKIERINMMIDSPKHRMAADSLELGKLPGLSYREHRRRNHTLLSAGITGYRRGGLEGVAIAWTHLLIDAGRDQVVRVSGEEAADIFEDLINVGYSLYRKHKK